MRRVRRLAGVLLGAVLAAAGDPQTLPAGQRVLVAVPAGAGGAMQELAFVPATGGAWTVLAESLDGNVLVRLLDERGDTLAEDDDGGVEGNARLVLPQVEAGRPLRLLVCLKQATAGEATVEARPGEVPRPEGAALAQASGQFRLERGRRRAQRGETKAAAQDLALAGNQLFAAQRYADVCAALDEALPLLEQVGDTRFALYARGFRACSLARLGALAEAQPLLEAAAAEAAAAGDRPLEMLVVSDLATTCRSLGLLAPAEQHATRALELARALGDRGNEVILLASLARLQRAQGRPDDSRATCEQAEALAVQLGSPPLQLEALRARAELQAERGDPRGARSIYLRALALPATPWDRANLLGALGDVELVLGDTFAAAGRYREAARLAEDLGDPTLLATATVGLGLVELALGDPARARDALQAALAALGENGPPVNRAETLLQLAQAQLELGERAAARRSAEEAQRIAATANDPVRQAKALVGQANVDRVEDQHEAALVRLREAQDLFATARRPREAAQVLSFVAYHELRRGNLPAALELATAALALLTEMGCTRDTVHPLCTMAEAAIRGDDSAAAGGWLRQAERALQATADSSSDPRQLADLRSGETEHTPGQLAQDLAALRLRQAGRDARVRSLALDAALRSCAEWKGRVLLAGLERQRAGGDDAAAERLLTERRRTLADRDAAVTELVAATAAGKRSGEKDLLRQRLASLDAQAARLTTELARLSPREADFDAPPVWGLDAVRACLGPNDVYVEYAESIERLYAYVVTKSAAELRDLGSRAERAAQVETFVAGITDPARLADVEQVAAAGRALHDALLGGVLPEGVAPDARLLVVPCALLSALPLEALVVEAPAAPAGFGELVFVLDRREVVYAPSGPVLAHLRGLAPRATPGRALVLGDPVYPPVDGAVPRGSRDPRSLGFVRLPGTRDEALGIARRLDASWSPADEATDVTLDTDALRLRLGTGAAAGALAGDLREFALVHCAAHGHVDAQDPRLTGLALTPQGEDDGFVTLADVLELSLDADLAVLSACETGRGRERRGEGTQSLARAFLHAGARAVVSSLWQVDDRETERTMQDFYAGLADRGLTASAALREARLAIRRAPASPDAFRGVGRGKLLPGAKVPEAAAGRADLAGHPFFWAAFTYVGPPDLRPLGAR